jgi:hypothetical protein
VSLSAGAVFERRMAFFVAIFVNEIAASLKFIL